MKFKLILLFGFTVFAFQSCYFSPLESVSGNGVIVTEEREVESFDRLKVENGMDVFITQGDSEHVRLEVDENLLEHILTEVLDGELRIYSDANIRVARSKKIFVSYRSLNSLKISSAGDVKGTNTLRTDNLDIDLSSAGNLELDVISREIKVGISSSGNVTLTGETEYLEADLSSAGDLNAFDLVANKGNIDVSSAGDAKVNITEEADFNASSAGDIVYTGNPRIVNINESSAGDVRRR